MIVLSTFHSPALHKFSRNIVSQSKRFLSSAEIIARQSKLFSAEQKRQYENLGRIEKIEVNYIGVPENTALVMNKNLSTPYNCAQHLGETHCQRSALALLDGTIPWDMHRPLPNSCTLELLNFTVEDPRHVNKAFWRTCSFMLGAALTTAFKESAKLNLHSFPTPSVRSGSFVYDFSIAAPDFKPTKQEMRAFSAEMIKLAAKDLKIERLDVSHDVALEIFEYNPFKREQLPSISNQNDGVVTLYRAGDHIDISRGPMVATTRHLGKCTIAAIHKLECPDMEGVNMYRAQGVALPLGLHLNHFAFGVLEERARKLNNARLPNEQFAEEPEKESKKALL
ncbi:large ribosomal subunit protein mL39 [Culicoides brevitarsis]|uniref:large ribosomal subunit protein mL39 n=1 Tax=Culicoides brevitarsis TaxID=469753 RepID=UPI00307C5601